MTIPDTVWTCAHLGEYGRYFPEAVEAEGEYGGEAVALALKAPLVARIETLEAENKRLRDLPRKIMARGGTIGEVCLAMTPASDHETEVERIIRTLAKEPTP